MISGEKNFGFKPFGENRSKKAHLSSKVYYSVNTDTEFYGDIVNQT